MPEIAAAYAVGIFLTLALVGLHIYLQSRKQQNPSMRQLQKNLKKINLFWSESESAIKTYTPGAEKQDAAKSIRSILISGAGFSFLSWLGFFLQLMLMFSLRYLAVKRVETRLFESELTEKDLDAEKSRDLVAKIMQS